MLPEALVIFACVNSTGCSETSSQYFNTYPEYRQIIEANEKRAKEFVGPLFIDTFGPAIYMVAGGTGTVHLTRNFTLQINKSQSTLSYRLEW